jgi:hypothetical protein
MNSHARKLMLLDQRKATWQAVASTSQQQINVFIAS